MSRHVGSDATEEMANTLCRVLELMDISNGFRFTVAGPDGVYDVTFHDGSWVFDPASPEVVAVLQGTFS